MENSIGFTVMITGGDHSPPNNARIEYNTVVTNKGGGYSVQRNEFVTPEVGTYAFYTAAMAINNGVCKLALYKNEEVVGHIYSDHNVDAMGSNMFVLELSEADAVSVRAVASGCQMNGGDNYNTFSGFKLN